MVEEKSTGLANMRRLLLEAATFGASDLHLVSGQAPRLRVHGVLSTKGSPLSEETLGEMLRSVCPVSALDSIKGSVDEAARLMGDKLSHDIDFSFEANLGGQRLRFRINVFYARGHLGACIRLIPATVPTVEWAGLPAGVVENICGFRNGLVLVTGVTGSGKSTTLAIILETLVRRRGCRVVTIEEPVEYVHTFSDNALITQREVGVDVPSYAAGLKYGLRQDPDVILVGEIRDRETAQMALTAAETGHLVLTTIHTRDAKGAVSRYTDLFPSDRSDEICAQLALNLRAVLSQHLLPNARAGEKRALGFEVMFNNLPVRSAIRANNLVALGDAILTGKADGMVTLDESLIQLVNRGAVSEQTATEYASDATRMTAMLARQENVAVPQAAWQ